MKAHRYKLLFAVGLLLTLGLTNVLAGGDDSKKPSKNDGILSVKTSPAAYPVRIDGQDRGPSGVGTGREFYLAPGFHTVEVMGPDGKTWKQEIEIHRGERHCVCVKVIQDTFSKPCPYRFHIEGPDKVTEGDPVTFVAIPDVTSPIPLRYVWHISNGKVTSDLGKPTITVDSTGVGNKTIDAELDVNDDVYDGKCRQVITAPPVPVTTPSPVPTPTSIICDEFDASIPDKVKPRFDNCTIQVQAAPDAQLYVIIYPGTDKLSTTRNTYDKSSKFMLDYLVKTRGLDPRRIKVVQGSTRLRTRFVIWIVPPGAPLPVP